MGIIITISGCRAVGKSTLIQGLKKNLVDVSYREGLRRMDLGFNLQVESEYYQNEKCYIRREIKECKKAKLSQNDHVFIRGPEDLELYALHYPETMGFQWSVESGLHEELCELRKTSSDFILYLTADVDVIQDRCRHDKEKTRTNINEWLSEWEPYYYEHMKKKPNTTVLDTNNMTSNEVLIWVLEWMKGL